MRLYVILENHSFLYKNNFSILLFSEARITNKYIVGIPCFGNRNSCTNTVATSCTLQHCHCPSMFTGSQQAVRNCIKCEQYKHIIAERISARQYKSGSILGIYVRMYVRMYVRTYVRSSAQARTSRHSLRRRRRLDMYARAYTV